MSLPLAVAISMYICSVYIYRYKSLCMHKIDTMILPDLITYIV